MRSELAPPRYPRVPLWRRGAALGIDFLSVALLSLAMGTSAIAQGFVFIATWLTLRVVLVSQNQGQSLGRWALDMRVVDSRRGRTPGLQELALRESILSIVALLSLFGITYLDPANGGAILLFIPLAADGLFAVFDLERRQALHDQLCHTLIVPSRRGYSLDLKLKRWWLEARSRWDQRSR